MHAGHSQLCAEKTNRVILSFADVCRKIRGNWRSTEAFWPASANKGSGFDPSSALRISESPMLPLMSKQSSANLNLIRLARSLITHLSCQQRRCKMPLLFSPMRRKRKKLMKWCLVKIRIHHKIAMKMLSRLLRWCSAFLCAYYDFQAWCSIIKFVKLGNTGRLHRILTNEGYIWRALECFVSFAPFYLFLTLRHYISLTGLKFLLLHNSHNYKFVLVKKGSSSVAFSKMTYGSANCGDVFIYEDATWPLFFTTGKGNTMH